MILNAIDLQRELRYLDFIASEKLGYFICNMYIYFALITIGATRKDFLFTKFHENWLIKSKYPLGGTEKIWIFDNRNQFQHD